MDTPIELLTQALLGELPEERKRCFEAWLQESEEHRLLWERFRQQGYFENFVGAACCGCRRGFS